jgi:RNA polymerase sigma-70 factor (ECF subfamily)
MSSMIESFTNRSWNSSFTSMTLLDKARQNDEAAWEMIVKLYAPLVYRWCKRAGMSYHDIENLSQDVFTVAYRKLDRFQKKTDSDSFRGWLYTLVRNKRIDWLRKHKNDFDAIGGSQVLLMQQQIPDAAWEDSEELDQSEQEDVFLFNQAIQLIRQEFGPRDQKIIEALLCENQDPREIAVQLGISRNSIYIVKSRVMRRLR